MAGGGSSKAICSDPSWGPSWPLISVDDAGVGGKDGRGISGSERKDGAAMSQLAIWSRAPKSPISNVASLAGRVTEQLRGTTKDFNGVGQERKETRGGMTRIWEYSLPSMLKLAGL